MIIKRLKRLHPKLRRRHALVLLAVLLIFFGVLAFYFGKRVAQPPVTVNQLYQKEMQSLSSDLTELSNYLDQEKEINQDIAQYTSGLTNLKNSCRQMNIYYERYKDTDISVKTADTMSNVRQLCNDLLDVLDYSQAVFTATGPYLTINTGQWPYASAESFKWHIESIGQTINASQESLKTVKNNVEDPAAGEMIAQIELSKQKHQQAISAYSSADLAAADAYTEELIALLNQDKQDFINARTYFWRSTVKLDALRKTIDTLAVEFSL